jgi:hypothetical protein
MLSDRISLNGSAPNKRKPTLAERDREAEQRLSTRYDALNQLFIEAEQRLKSLKPLHPVWVQYGHDPFGAWEILGITKHQGKWRLCHAYDHEMNDDGPFREVKPIVECAIDIRICAARFVRRLNEEIVKSKEEYVPKVDEAIKDLTEFCNQG